MNFKHKTNTTTLKILPLLVTIGIFLTGLVFAAQWLAHQKTQTLSQASHGMGERYLDPVFSELITSKDLTYSKIDGKNLDLDIYEPKNDGANLRPAIIWIHSGGFAIGKKEDIAGLAQEFAKRGYVSLSINYRLSGEDMDQKKYPTPDQIKNIPVIMHALADAQTAIRWTRANAEKYRIDPNQVFVAGGSAGGVTALLVDLNVNHAPTNREYSQYSATVSATVSIMGTADPAMIDSNEPPVIMFNGGQDTLIKPTWALAFQKQLQAKNVEYEAYWYPEAQHGQAPYADVIQKTAQFLFNHLSESLKGKPGPEPTALVTQTPKVHLTLVPPRPSTVPTVTKTQILLYFQQNPQTACRLINNYLKMKNLTIDRFTHDNLKELTAANDTAQKVVIATAANATTVQEAYLQVCMKKY